MTNKLSFLHNKIKNNIINFFPDITAIYILQAENSLNMEIGLLFNRELKKLKKTYIIKQKLNKEINQNIKITDIINLSKYPIVFRFKFISNAIRIYTQDPKFSNEFEAFCIAKYIEFKKSH